MEGNNIVSKIEISKFEPEICAPCLVCGECVKISHVGNHTAICDKCRKAILKMRRDMENE